MRRAQLEHELVLGAEIDAATARLNKEGGAAPNWFGPAFIHSPCVPARPAFRPDFGPACVSRPAYPAPARHEPLSQLASRSPPLAAPEEREGGF